MCLGGKARVRQIIQLLENSYPCCKALSPMPCLQNAFPRQFTLPTPPTSLFYLFRPLYSSSLRSRLTLLPAPHCRRLRADSKRARAAWVSPANSLINLSPVSHPERRDSYLRPALELSPETQHNLRAGMERRVPSQPVLCPVGPPVQVGAGGRAEEGEGRQMAPYPCRRCQWDQGRRGRPLSACSRPGLPPGAAAATRCSTWCPGHGLAKSGWSRGAPC